MFNCRCLYKATVRTRSDHVLVLIVRCLVAESRHKQSPACAQRRDEIGSTKCVANAISLLVLSLPTAHTLAFKSGNAFKLLDGTD